MEVDNQSQTGVDNVLLGSVGACVPLEGEPTYCLDVVVGYNESYREELINFLRQAEVLFQIGMMQRGKWNGMNILRIETPKAADLARFICEGLRTGDDNDYVIHDTCVDAQRSDTWLPDFDSPHGYKSFSFKK